MILERIQNDAKLVVESMHYNHSCLHPYTHVYIHTYINTHLFIYRSIFKLTYTHRHAYICTYINICTYSIYSFGIPSDYTVILMKPFFACRTLKLSFAIFTQRLRVLFPIVWCPCGFSFFATSGTIWIFTMSTPCFSIPVRSHFKFRFRPNLLAFCAKLTFAIFAY